LGRPCSRIPHSKVLFSTPPFHDAFPAETPPGDERDGCYIARYLAESARARGRSRELCDWSAWWLPAKWQWDMADVWAGASQKGNDLGRRSDGEVSQAQTAQRVTPLSSSSSPLPPSPRLIEIAPKDIRTETNRLINTSQRLLMNLTKCPKIV